MIITAAHCVYEHDAPTPTIDIYYENRHGHVIKRTAKKIFLSEYHKASRKIVAMVDKGGEQVRKALSKERFEQVQIMAAQYDLALVLPEYPIELDEYAPSTILDDDLPFAAALESLRTSERPWNDAEHAKVVGLLNLHQSQFSRDYSLSIGYGSTTCNYDDTARATSCTGDGIRRFAQLKRHEDRDLSVGPRGRAIIQTIAFEPGAVATLRGDSGGPLFVNDTITGKLRLVGIASRSHPKIGIFASLVQNAQIWKQFEADPEYHYALMHQRMYGVLSLALSNSGSTRYTSAGMAVRDSYEEAVKAAHEICAKNGMKGCKVKHVFGHSRDDCSFVAQGINKTKGYSVGIASNEKESLARCRRGGFECSKVIKACAY